MSLLYFTSFIILSHTECITHFILLAFCLSQPPELQPLDKYNFDIYNVKCLYVACSLEHMGIHHTSLAFVPLGKAAIDPPAQLCLFRLHCCLPSCSLLVLRDVTEKMKPSFFLLLFPHSLKEPLCHPLAFWAAGLSFLLCPQRHCWEKTNLSNT